MPKALVLLGATATGKSELAMWLARQSNTPVQILVADSMQVYKGLDIGTAKPTAQERKEVKHHCLDLAEPSEDFSLELYKKTATEILENDTTKDFNTLIVGGTGLYIRALVDDLQIPPQYLAVREELELEEDTQSLWSRLNELDPKAASIMLPNNRRRIIRALEVTLGSGKPFSSFGKGLKEYGDTEFLQVGIKMPRPILDSRINARYEAQMEAGFLKEVEELLKKDLSKTARQALGYKELLTHLEDGLSLDEALETAKKRTKRFARRQERWFRRDPRINWIEADSPATAQKSLLKLYQDYFKMN